MSKMAKMTSIQLRHSEKWLARVVNLKSYSLDSHFRGVDVPDDRAAAVLRREIEIMKKPMQVNEERTNGRLRIHSNQWYQFDLKPETAAPEPVVDKTEPTIHGGVHDFGPRGGVPTVELRPAAVPKTTVMLNVLDEIDEMMTAWDNMNNAAQRMLTALPSQMTEAAAYLDETRKLMGAAVRKVGMTGFKK